MQNKPTIKQLQKQGFKKTYLNCLYLTNTGKAYNYSSKREIAPTKKGKIVINKKTYNLAKLLLQTFKNIPIRNGYMNHIDKNKGNFNIDNLEYLCTVKIDAPKETDIINSIRLYFRISIKFKISNIVVLKFYLFQIAKMRGFIYKYKSKDFDLFIDWLKPNITIYKG